MVRPHDAGGRFSPSWSGVIVVALVGLGAVVWKHVLEPRLTPRAFAPVIPGEVYRSGQISRFLIRDTLKEYDIGVIVFMSGDKAGQPDVEAERAAAAEMGITRYNFPLGGRGMGDWRE